MSTLDQPNLANIMKLMVRTSLAIKPGENVLILAGTEEELEIATFLYAETKSVGAEAAITIIDPRKNVHHEPPPFVAESMRRADVVIAVAYTLFYTKAKEEALSAGARFAQMGGEGKKDLVNLNFAERDIELCVDRARRLADRVTRSSTVEVTSERGTQLTLSLRDRKGVQLLPFCREPGSFCCLPDYTEVACAVVEGSAEGILVCDGTILAPPRFERVVDEPVTFRIRHGKIEDISGAKEAVDIEAILSQAGPKGRLLGEFGMGATHNPRKLRGARGDMSSLGTIHMGFGKNDMLGGKIDARSHMDFMVREPTLKLDEIVLIEGGRFVLEE